MDPDFKNISIAQFFREFKTMPNGQKLLFSFYDPSVINKEQIRTLFKVETKNIITIRELDNKKVWLYCPKKDTILKSTSKNVYLLNGYLSDGSDLKIEVIN